MRSQERKQAVCPREDFGSVPSGWDFHPTSGWDFQSMSRRRGSE